MGVGSGMGAGGQNSGVWGDRALRLILTKARRPLFSLQEELAVT